MTPTVTLRWERVTARYGSRAVLSDISLTAHPGRMLGVVGSNGAGKTTLLRLACGLLEPADGRVCVGDQVVSPRAAPQGLGALIEEPRFYPWADGRRNLEAMCAGRRDRMERIDGLLEEVGLIGETRRPVHEYSQGMRQRLGIARALLGDPALLLLDEPSNGLDPLGMRWLEGLLVRLRQEGKTLVVSSHVLSQLERGADDVAILADGRVLLAGALGTVVRGGESLEDVYFRLADHREA